MAPPWILAPAARLLDLRIRVLWRRRHARSWLDRPAALLARDRRRRSGCARWRTSLYSGPGPRPGPDVLYGAPAVAPQLENVGVWSAAPILVSGASAYRGGEFLYQDFLYDDHGAAEAPDPTDPKGGGNLFSKPDGTYTYPTAPAYANDA